MSMMITISRTTIVNTKRVITAAPSGVLSHGTFVRVATGSATEIT